ncbi:vomeronasal type-1 receptor 4-like [Alexandromys fortis]|uniref:vomeronasal type-1 receptor 4-like n=1 Tax=Alexandromys fortis TaxID=100897 RepID=UPI0021526D19|nr:vomeronasal type-1 receptor 4-like [Microtus fortis]
MADSEVAIGVIFLSQTMVGALGNFYLLHHYLLSHFRKHTLRSTDWILMHLTIANALTLLCRGMPQTMAALGLKDFLNDFECKVIFYLNRVGRGVSIGSTSFLSIFQAITISPMESIWAELKGRRQKHIVSSVYLSWILYMLVNSLNLVYLRAKYNKNNTASLKDLGYCAATPTERIKDILYATLLSVPDFLFVGLMVWASTSMVLILHRHKQRMQHMPRAMVCSRSSPESRATQTIIFLVSTFAFFYTLSCISMICIILSSHHRWLLLQVSALFSGCFPTVSPFLLMSHEFSVSRCFCFISIKNA